MGKTEQLTLSAGPETEALVNFIFKELSDQLVDQIDLKRVTPATGGVAREFITTGALLTLAPALALPVFRLIERWMETNRQREAVNVIYQASKQDKELMKTLAELEKRHSDLMIKYAGRVGSFQQRNKA
jgi:hypothetical protein